MNVPDYNKAVKTNGRMSRLMVIFKKEVRDHLRDRRTLLLALIYPLLAPLLVAGGLYLAGTTIQSERTAVAFDVVVVGADNSPLLIEHLEAHDISIVVKTSLIEAKKLVLDGHIPVGLVIPENAEGEKRFTV
ncbi:MAG: hypothetical protein KAI27_00800, partial [Rhodospirillaceae bacterium]|nr:hypothetical protein [Rhodospirillaceae bacterium]